MFRAIVLFSLMLAWTAPAGAAPSVGVVVIGDKAVETTAEQAVDAWLGNHEFAVEPNGLTKDGINTLANCLALADMTCAHGVVEQRSKVETLVVIVAQASGKKGRDIQLSAYWMSKYSDVVSLQRTCRACAGPGLPPVVEAVLTDLSKMVPAMTGKLEIKSTPPGLLATVDGEAAGVTPIVRDVPAGSHEVMITRDGKTIDRRTITVTAGETVPIAITAPALPAPKPVLPKTVVVHRSRLGPAIVLGLGLATAGAGVYMYLEGGPTGNDYYYRDYRTPGIGVAAAGGALALVGTILLFRAGATEVPVVAVSHDSALVGWTGRF
jgi:hypothetical protein